MDLPAATIEALRELGVAVTAGAACWPNPDRVARAVAALLEEPPSGGGSARFT